MLERKHINGLLKLNKTMDLIFDMVDESTLYYWKEERKGGNEERAISNVSAIVYLFGSRESISPPWEMIGE